MFYLVFVLGCALAVTIVVALVRDDVPNARRWALVLIGSVALGPLATLLGSALGLPEGVGLLIGLVVTPLGFTAGALGTGLVMIRGGEHRDLGIALLISAGSMALLAIYGGFAVIITSIADGNPPYQGPLELLVELVVATGVFIGGAGAILAYARRGTRYRGSLRRLP